MYIKLHPINMVSTYIYLEKYGQTIQYLLKSKYMLQSVVLLKYQHLFFFIYSYQLEKFIRCFRYYQKKTLAARNGMFCNGTNLKKVKNFDRLLQILAKIRKNIIASNEFIQIVVQKNIKYNKIYINILKKYYYTNQFIIHIKQQNMRCQDLCQQQKLSLSSSNTTQYNQNITLKTKPLLQNIATKVKTNYGLQKNSVGFNVNSTSQILANISNFSLQHKIQYQQKIVNIVGAFIVSNNRKYPRKKLKFQLEPTAPKKQFSGTVKTNHNTQEEPYC
eukprot:TRINITY_DN15500_c0_g1_i1.p1 TRINITY_DN15500_c0_g1~~TRINITY_DN15500_c0_g1_i1.p1  ORF type:complete len:275 (+),score=-11.42 TRINITY_DN15500_c0_g1_i1:555-1379(+)